MCNAQDVLEWHPGKPLRQERLDLDSLCVINKVLQHETGPRDIKYMSNDHARIYIGTWHAHRRKAPLGIKEHIAHRGAPTFSSINEVRHGVYSRIIR
jgi:hypothetical protein